MTTQLQGPDPSSETSSSPKNSSEWPRGPLSRQEIAALREGDVVLVRMEVRRPLGEHGTVHCRIHDEKTWRSHYVPVFPEHIVEKMPQKSYVGVEGYRITSGKAETRR
jgi:hypothetical protein